MQYIVTLVHLSVFVNVYSVLANNPCDKIAGIPFIDSTLGWSTASGFLFALPCLFYTLMNALVPSNKREEDIAQNMYSVVANSLSVINSQSKCSSKTTSHRADSSISGNGYDVNGIIGRSNKWISFLTRHVTKVIVLLVDVMGEVLKNYLIDLEVMSSGVLGIVKVETSSDILVFNRYQFSKGRDLVCETSGGAELPWFKVLIIILS